MPEEIQILVYLAQTAQRISQTASAFVKEDNKCLKMATALNKIQVHLLAKLRAMLLGAKLANQITLIVVRDA